eukprot:6702400-Prymnesium_polylepis.1
MLARKDFRRPAAVGGRAVNCSGAASTTCGGRSSFCASVTSELEHGTSTEDAAPLSLHSSWAPTCAAS